MSLLPVCFLSIPCTLKCKMQTNTTAAYEGSKVSFGEQKGSNYSVYQHHFASSVTKKAFREYFG